ncbi:TOG array regulator of axonemal microtubules protein 2-like isoform X1 [Anguilla rostrata]|uniref:TOG array regulator of axonemal microtubules protein 2-like isoform X1 n=2 Tax=Anguilla rostrata TaxID=7938 RepID=UPI0030D04D45
MKQAVLFRLFYGAFCENICIMDFLALRGKISKFRSENLRLKSDISQSETEDFGAKSVETDPGQSWEEQQHLTHALSLQGKSHSMLDAFSKMFTEKAEVKLAHINRKFDLTSEVSSSSVRAPHLITPTPAPSLARAPTLRTNFGRFDRINPPVTSTQSPKMAQKVGKERSGFKNIKALPPHVPGPYQPGCISSMIMSGNWLSVNALSSVSSTYSAGGSGERQGMLLNPKDSRVFLPDAPEETGRKLPHLHRAVKNERAPQQPSGWPETRIGPQSHRMHLFDKKTQLKPVASAQAVLERNRACLPGEGQKSILPPQTEAQKHQETHRLPMLAKAKAALDRYKARQTSKGVNSGSRRPAKSRIILVGQSTPQSKEELASLPALAITKISEESKTHTPKHPTAGPKRGFFNLRKFSSKVAPSTTLENTDELPLDTPTEIKEVFFPFPNPQAALNQGFLQLSSDNWEKKICGLNSFRRLAQHNSGILSPKLHKICKLVMQEVQNPQSQVSHVAMATLGDLYQHLPDDMDAELDWTAKVLLQKAAESNNGIRQDVGVALGHMLRSCSPARCMKALLKGGLSDRNAAVRACAARQLAALVEFVGAPHLLTFTKKLLNDFLSAVSRLPQDASQEVRSCGKTIMQALSGHEEMNEKLLKFISQHRPALPHRPQ